MATVDAGSARAPARHLTGLGTGVLLLGATNRVRNVNQVTLMQQRSPEAMVGRIASAPLAAVLFALAVTTLIPVRGPDVPVGAPHDVTTARGAR